MKIKNQTFCSLSGGQEKTGQDSQLSREYSCKIRNDPRGFYHKNSGRENFKNKTKISFPHQFNLKLTAEIFWKTVVKNERNFKKRFRRRMARMIIKVTPNLVHPLTTTKMQSIKLSHEQPPHIFCLIWQVVFMLGKSHLSQNPS